MSTATCKWCKESFERPNKRGPAPKYCSTAHRQKAYRARRDMKMTINGATRHLARPLQIGDLPVDEKLQEVLSDLRKSAGAERLMRKYEFGSRLSDAVGKEGQTQHMLSKEMLALPDLTIPTSEVEKALESMNWSNLVSDDVLATLQASVDAHQPMLKSIASATQQLLDTPINDLAPDLAEQLKEIGDAWDALADTEVEKGHDLLGGNHIAKPYPVDAPETPDVDDPEDPQAAASHLRDIEVTVGDLLGDAAGMVAHPELLVIVAGFCFRILGTLLRSYADLADSSHELQGLVALADHINTFLQLAAAAALWKTRPWTGKKSADNADASEGTGRQL